MLCIAGFLPIIPRGFTSSPWFRGAWQLGAALIVLWTPQTLQARPEFLRDFNAVYLGVRFLPDLPALEGCAFCHMSSTPLPAQCAPSVPQANFPLNLYGCDVRVALAGTAELQRAVRAIEPLDSDRSTASNLAEIIAGALPGDANNEPPFADAGLYPQVTAGDLVTLSGANSRDVDTQGPTTVTFAWRQTGGPVVVLSDRSAARPTFTAPAVTLGATLTFALRVTDNEGAFSDAVPEAMVTVSPVNQAPMAMTGPAQTVRAGTLVTLDGSPSFDPDGVIRAFAWRQTAGPTVEISDPAAMRPTFVAPTVVGANVRLTFELQVTDSGGLMATALAVVMVLDSAPAANTPPLAILTEFQRVLPGMLVTLDGSRSLDPDGIVLTFAWRQTAGPVVSLADPTAMRPTFVAPAVVGLSVALTFELQVTDADGLMAAALAVVEVVNLPVADAGAAQTVLEGEGVRLDGSRSRDGGGGAVSTFRWRQLDVGGSPPVTFSDALAAQPTFIAPAVAVPTVLTFELQVTDSQGLMATAMTVVQVLHDDGSRDEDGDGIGNVMENGAPNNGDSNNDGVLDRLQGHVASLRDSAQGQYVTLVAPVGTRFVNVRLIDNPSPQDVPPGLTFPLGFLTFTLQGLAPGATATVSVRLPSSVQINAYVKNGPTPALAFAHWYRLLFEATPGITLGPNLLTIRLVDGQDGDDDVMANGSITSAGAMAIQRAIVTDDSGAEGGGSSGAGCTLRPGQGGDVLLPALLLVLLALLAWRRSTRYPSPPPAA
ncbi:MAG: choice-of-anchor U domain-containing protein [Candidatus Tectimicrobiota bacterium]